MFIFHEGLPGSGKSYESIVNQIIPALKKGRKVFAYINGLNHQKIAELIDKTEDETKQLLIQLQPDQLDEIYNHIEKDSLVVLDEMQNFWPSKRNAMSKEMTTWIAEHRHDGQDIIGMGQSIADVNAVWRRRCEQKIQFLKLSMVGKPKKYKWTMYQGVPNSKGNDVTFIKTKSGTKDYDEKYFGSYKSHKDGTSNYDTKDDDRINIFNNNTFKVAIPLFLVAVVYALFWLYNFFTGSTDIVKTDQQTSTASTPVTTNQQSLKPTLSNGQQLKPILPPKLKSDDIANFVLTNNQSYRGKVVYKDERGGVLFDALVVWIDDNNRMIDQLYLEDFRQLGFKIQNRSYGFIARKEKAELLFRYLPDYDAFATVPEDTREQL